MNKKSETSKDATDKLVKGIKQKTRKQYSAEEKIRFVLACLRGEESIAALCRHLVTDVCLLVRGPWTTVHDAHAPQDAQSESMNEQAPGLKAAFNALQRLIA